MIPAGDMSFPAPSRWRLLQVLLFVLLGAGCVVVLRPFLSPIIWAVILAYVTWPVYRRLHRYLGGRDTLTAVLATGFMSTIVVVPPLWLLLLAHDELAGASESVSVFFSEPHRLSNVIGRIPGLGPRLKEIVDPYWSDPSWWGRELTGWMQAAASALGGGLAAVSRNLAKLALAALTLFFLYRDGGALWLQIRRVATRFGVQQFDHRLPTIPDSSP